MPPFSFGSIILPRDCNRFIDDGQISDCDSPPSWGTVNPYS